MLGVFTTLLAISAYSPSLNNKYSKSFSNVQKSSFNVNKLQTKAKNIKFTNKYTNTKKKSIKKPTTIKKKSILHDIRLRKKQSILHHILLSFLQNILHHILLSFLQNILLHIVIIPIVYNGVVKNGVNFMMKH